MAKRINVKDAEIKMVPYDGTPNPHNPHDRLTPEERHKKIVNLYARIYLRMVEKKEG